MSYQFLGLFKDDTFTSIFEGEENPNLNALCEIFIFPEIENEREFNSTEFDLAPDEWFYVELSDEDKSELIDRYILISESTAGINQIESQQYNSLRGLFLVRTHEDNAVDIIFNRVFDRNCISNRTLFKFDVSGPVLNTESNVVEFNKSIDAYWEGATKRLYFKKYNVIKPLFIGIDKFYRLATDSEVNSFLGAPFFSVDERFNSGSLGERSRSNIASIIDEEGIDFDDPVVQRKYVKYSKSFPELNVEVKGGKFCIAKSKDLTNIVKVLQELVWVTTVTRKKKVASSAGNLK